MTCPKCGRYILIRQKHGRTALPYLTCVECGYDVWITSTGKIYQAPATHEVYLPRGYHIFKGRKQD